MKLNIAFKITRLIIDAIDVLCVQLTRDLFAIAKFLFCTNTERDRRTRDTNCSLALKRILNLITTYAFLSPSYLASDTLMLIGVNDCSVRVDYTTAFMT